MKKDILKVKSKGKTVIKIVFLIFTVVFIVTVIAFNVSPVPGSLLVRLAFDRPPQKPPEELNYSAYVQVSKNISYGDSKDEIYDLYIPKGKNNLCPLIIWIHGGAFVGGDKKDVAFLAEALAFNGYAVAAINYSRAPEAVYPEPVLQTGKAYSYLTEKYSEGNDAVDTNQIFIAGDSAGAHIAAQFAILQTNITYREKFLAANNPTIFPEPISKEVLKGTLLYCGPYDVEKLNNVSNPLMKFLLGQTSWAYFGHKNLANSVIAEEADIIKSVTKDFPPSFISDGNTASFYDHARDLTARLSTLGVPVSELFFDDSSEKVPHEFQFELQSNVGKKSLEYTLRFLEENINGLR